jgi:hypothetical protein
MPNWGVSLCLPCLVVVQYVYVIGGVGPDGAVLSSIERLRLDSDGTATATGPNAQWELLPQPLNRARAGAYATVTLGGSRIQVFGGVGEDGQGLDSTEVLSAATGQHIASDNRRGYGKRMNVPRSYVVAAAPATSATSDTTVVLLGADADPSANEVFTIISV